MREKEPSNESTNNMQSDACVIKSPFKPSSAEFNDDTCVPSLSKNETRNIGTPRGSITLPTKCGVYFVNKSRIMSILEAGRSRPTTPGNCRRVSLLAAAAPTVLGELA